MVHRADGLPRSEAVRTGGFLSGILLATPPFYVVFGAVASVLSQIPVGAAGPGSTLAQLALGVVAATAFSGVSLFGYGWIYAGGRLRVALFAAAVLTAALAVAVVSAFLFVDAIAWAVDNGSLPVLGIGVIGLCALAWAGVRGGQGALAGYRNVG